MTATPVLVRANPYPGIVPFKEEDASRFFGRDKEIDDILERLASRRLLAVIGVSGCGKSSLIGAGVIPVLRIGAAEHLPGPWRIHTITPGNGPLEALRAVLGAGPNWPATSFALVEHARNNLRPGEKLLLIVDQFEELFRFRAETFDKDAGNAAALFVNLLLNAADQREIPIYVMLTMRTDFLGECALFRGLPEALNDCYYLVPRMTRLQQQEAIERPLQDQEAEMTPALVQRLLNDSAEDPDHLPVLQHLLKRLWESWSARGEEGPINLDDDYGQVGGWENAIGEDAESVLRRFPSEEDNIRRLFQWITDRGTGEKPIRRPRPFAECAEVSGLSRERLGEIVRAFQDRRLLRLSDRSATSLVDLPHESVMWQWSRLHDWIAAEAEQATYLRFILQSAQKQVPLTGLALEAALKLCSERTAQSGPALRYLKATESEQISAWIAQSRDLEENKLTAAEARELTAWAAASLSEDPERSLILGLYAWGKQRAMVPGLEQLLHDALLQSRSRLSLRGHQSYLWIVAWSPDRSKLATASSDTTAKIWEASTGRELLTLRGHQSPVLCVAWSPDGSKLVTASSDTTAKIWEASTGRELLTLRGHEDRVYGVAWSPDGQKLATASWDKTGKVWEPGTGRELLTFRGHEDRVYSVAWSPDGAKLATGSRDNKAKIWDASKGRELLNLRSHLHYIESVAWSPDGSKLATASWDKTAKIWDASKGGELLTLRGHQSYVESVAWSPDGSKLATASQDQTAKVWDAGTGQESLTLRGHQSSVYGVAWSPDGSQLATASWDSTAKVWAMTACELLTLRGHENGIVYSVGWSPDGSKLATGSQDKTAKEWEAGTGRELLTLRGHRDAVLTVAWSPDGSKLATSSEDHTAKVWQVSTGRELLTLRGHQRPVSSVVWSPDGAKLATGSRDNNATIWAANTGRELLTMRGHQSPVWNLAWSPDGARLATASEDATAKIWDAGDARELLTLPGHSMLLLSAGWSPDGSKLATASFDQTAKICDPSTGRELLTLRGHQNAIWTIAWSPNGSKLASASWDNTAKIWEAATGRELLTLRGHHGRVFGVAWSPDEKRLASVGEDGIVQIYTLDPMELLRLVRSRITRDLAPDECRRYLNLDNCPPVPIVPL